MFQFKYPGVVLLFVFFWSKWWMLLLSKILSTASWYLRPSLSASLSDSWTASWKLHLNHSCNKDKHCWNNFWADTTSFDRDPLSFLIFLGKCISLNCFGLIMTKLDGFVAKSQLAEGDHQVSLCQLFSHSLNTRKRAHDDQSDLKDQYPCLLDMSSVIFKLVCPNIYARSYNTL